MKGIKYNWSNLHGTYIFMLRNTVDQFIRRALVSFTLITVLRSSLLLDHLVVTIVHSFYTFHFSLYLAFVQISNILVATWMPWHEMKASFILASALDKQIYIIESVSSLDNI